MNSGEQKVAPSRPLGVFLIVVGLAGFVFAQGIPADAVGNNADPGPRLFPQLLSLLIFFGGVYESVRAFRSGGSPGPVPIWKEARARSFFVVPALLVGFFLLLPWMGFTVSVMLLVLGFLRLQGASWKVSIITGIALIVVVRFLFGWLFRVQLPEGWLDSFL